jgi:ABC-type multidrug transport system fused ATPase/permease subunit
VAVGASLSVYRLQIETAVAGRLHTVGQRQFFCIVRVLVRNKD